MTEPLWLSVARAFVGTQEAPGAPSNPLIMQWARDLQAPGYVNDGVAWCALFVNRILLACQLPLCGRGYDLLRAGQFASYGQDVGQPVPGAILVFKRPEGHHVGFYVGESPAAYAVLGGNQTNTVSVVSIARERRIAARWPAGYAVVGEVVELAQGGRLSQNEA